MNVTWRKARSGEWVVFGPTTKVRKGSVTVTKKNGETVTAEVERTSKTFDVDGVQCCYGYLASRTSHTSDASRRSAAAHTRRAGGTACVECGGYVQKWSDGAADSLCHDCV